MNYFEFFNIPVSFSVDEPSLRRLFYQNSKKYHPDYHTLADAQQQADMLELATLNTRAYQTLSDPDKRMRYVLELNGLLEDEGKQPPLPQAFLMDMMDLNEALMELEMDFDSERYSQTEQAITQVEQDLDSSIRPVLEKGAPAASDPADLKLVLEYFLKKRYLLRIRENLSKFAAR